MNSCACSSLAPCMPKLKNGPSISLWLTLFGVVAGFLSTFWSFGYTRLSRRLYKYLSTGPDDNSKRVKKTDVLNTLMRGSWINVLGLGSTLLGLQATVGLLVAKTLTNATANPFLAGGAGSYNPVLALDVFLVQVCFHFCFFTQALHWAIIQQSSCRQLSCQSLTQVKANRLTLAAFMHFSVDLLHMLLASLNQHNMVRCLYWLSS